VLALLHNGVRVLFNSYAFICVFLPLALLGYYGLARFGPGRAATAFLLVASIAFYGYWNPANLPLIFISMAFNYTVGETIARSPKGSLRGHGFLVFGVTANLLALGYFKYAGFLVQNIGALAGIELSTGNIGLPLAISFFTFQQIAYLVDAFHGTSGRQDPLRYGLFVTFFPHLIAGPLVHHREMIPQFGSHATLHPRWERFAVGLTLFSIGLFKKAVIADGIATLANPVFNNAASGVEPSLFIAWTGALAYTFQLYFDFSGYSDMAVGLARMFGIKLPMNFFSPYKATSIVEFWRRWHMTLSRFLRDYLYIALGGNRRGEFRRYLNLFITMLLGGLWHGAGWTFVIWGMLHGTCLALNHLWNKLMPKRAEGPFARVFGWTLTFLIVVIGWVIFRSADLPTAGRMLAGMIGMNGIVLPDRYEHQLHALAPVFDTLGMTFGYAEPFQLRTVLFIAGLLGFVLISPNAYEFLARYEPAIDFRAMMQDGKRKVMEWRPSPVWAVAFGVMAGLGVLSLTRVSEFLYFQF
jgi:D-alanyl-lipoteichoic acid acyltransferase DltB (MBOAT superfamily)